jgi:hypothetical protein
MLEQSSASYSHGAEEWRAVPGYEGRYEVSDLGRVRSLLLHGVSYGVSYDLVRSVPRVLQPTPTGARYLQVNLAGTMRLVHRLVLEAFVGLCPVGHEGAHLNGNRTDNRRANLAWKTPRENAADRERHGATARGDRHGSHTHPERFGGRR